MNDHVVISPLTEEMEPLVNDLIRRNMEGFDGSEVLLVGTLRRLKNLVNSYSGEGCQFLIAISAEDQRPVACVGLGPFHGLPFSEGVGEIRDLVVESAHRGQGIGKILLDRSIEAAKSFGYQRLYLETSKGMTAARNLFTGRGFRAVTLMESESSSPENVTPAYFLLEKL